VESLPRVDVIYITAGVSSDLIDAAAANGAKGLVTAGVGNGNMTAAALEALTRAVERGVAVVRSTRVTRGSVGRNIEIDDHDIGTVASGELNPAQARVLLKLVLLKTAEPGVVQDYFDRY
jgi:L-asparaginase